MAFLPHSVDDGHNLPFEYLPVSAITPEIGMALTQTSGNLATASGTTKPTYISMVEAKEAATAGDIIPVIRVTEDVIYETEASAAMTSIKLGSKVTLATDGLRVTATTTGGTFLVTYMSGTAVGSVVRGRFVDADAT